MGVWTDVETHGKNDNYRRYPTGIHIYGKGETTKDKGKATQETPKVDTEKESKKGSKKSKFSRKKKKEDESSSSSESESESELESSSKEETESLSSSEEDSDATSRRSKRKKYKHRSDHLNKVKFQVPAFEGKSDPDAYQDWEDRMERFFEVHRCSEKEKVKLAIMEFTRFATTWWKKVKKFR